MARRANTRRSSRTRNVLGLMAGTSADGIDAVCARITGKGSAMRVRFLWHRHQPFPRPLQQRLLAAMAPADTTTEELTRLHADLGEAFAEAARTAIQAAPRSQRPTLIGLAGQTVCHLPGRRHAPTVTLQLGEASRVAARTGLDTIADFRQSDVAAGGQGAPLVPWTDWVLMRDRTIGRAIQNIGGIANVTWLPPGGSLEDVVAFDTGPGNMVIDTLAARATRGRERMDRDGRRAARGRVLDGVLAAWLKHPFFRQAPPKTTGRETFGHAFVETQLGPLRQASHSPDDWIATATALTARSIARAYRRWLPVTRHPPALRELIACGGGAENPTLIGMIAAELPGVRIRPIASLGIPSQAKEALSFAMLAAACVDGVPANVPQATGAARPARLGRIVHP
ncbi:MAG: anhydro-N-acetylmuramic acid kinase [Phycisphaerae bacterium]|nr:anhydro-N-acetylmuramic acid kinase [Phycisphaerae bacterium]